MSSLHHSYLCSYIRILFSSSQVITFYDPACSICTLCSISTVFADAMTQFPPGIIKVSSHLISTTRVTALECGSGRLKAKRALAWKTPAADQRGSRAEARPTFCSGLLRCLMGLSAEPEWAMGTSEIDPTVPSKLNLSQEKDSKVFLRAGPVLM